MSQQIAMNVRPNHVAYAGELLSFEQLIANLSRRFVDLDCTRVFCEIKPAQKLVCEALGLDQSTLALWDAGAKSFVVTHSWTCSGSESDCEFKSQNLPWLADKVLCGEEVRFTRTSDPSFETSKDSETIGLLEPKYSVVFPLKAGGQVFGGLAFGNFRVEWGWQENIVDRLRLIANVFSNALAIKRSAEALTEAQEKMRSIVESAGLGWWTWNLARNEIRASEITYSLIGQPPGEPMTYPRFLDAVYPEDRALVRDSIRMVTQNPMEFDFDFRILHSDGAVKWVDCRGRSFADSNGKPSHISGLLFDVTNRKLSDDRFRLAVEASPIAMVMADGEGTIVLVNARVENIFGYRREELIGHSVDILVPRHVLEAIPALRAGSIAGANSTTTLAGQNVCALRKDGGEFRVEIRLNPIQTDESSLVLVTFTDVTERMESEKELMDANERLVEANRQIESFKEKLKNENICLREEIKVGRCHQEVIGQSQAIQRVLMRAEQAAPTNSTVLLLGETGTGKELIARAIHRYSKRGDRLMVKVNCAALPATLVENELFGREKGAYTGALTREIGRFELAHESTIFLDEIGELPLELQAKLLRVLQEGEFERLGSSRTIRVDARLIVATSRNLEAAVREGKFREDLYYRLNVFPIQIPPLRERREDIPMLTWHFLRDLGGRMGRKIESVRASTMNLFECYSWPGNVRELRNVIERHLITYNGTVFEAELPPMIRPPASSEDTAREVERRHIHRVLERSGWRIRGHGGAAETLDLKPTTLESRMRRLGIFRQ